ncbi:hypothetical protein ABW21_db0200059 [Orbilia brochopaga]|nr:hypothetical protein ABW21_db0200059 [Drechslerella brochopaga]
MQAVLGQRWHQAPKTHISYGGSGLGLFIARRLCFLLGGELHFDSKLGTGSTFSFFFHTQRTDPPHTSHATTPPEEPVRQSYSFGSDNKSGAEEIIFRPRRTSQPPPTKIARIGDRKLSRARSFGKLGMGYRVLVVEDNVLNQKILMKQLSAQGCDAVAANNGEEALDLLKKGEKFTVILMDMEMPVSNPSASAKAAISVTYTWRCRCIMLTGGIFAITDSQVMDGATSTGLIRELELKNGGHVPIIGTSANARMEQVQFMINAGMVSKL